MVEVVSLPSSRSPAPGVNGAGGFFLTYSKETLDWLCPRSVAARPRLLSSPREQACFFDKSAKSAYPFSMETPFETRGRKPLPARTTFGKRLRAYRLARHWTLADLAERSGLDLYTIHHLEHGRNQPTVRTVKKLAAALQCSLTELID